MIVIKKYNKNNRTILHDTKKNLVKDNKFNAIFLKACLKYKSGI